MSAPFDLDHDLRQRAADASMVMLSAQGYEPIFLYGCSSTQTSIPPFDPDILSAMAFKPLGRALSGKQIIEVAFVVCAVEDGPFPERPIDKDTMRRVLSDKDVCGQDIQMYFGDGVEISPNMMLCEFVRVEADHGDGDCRTAVRVTRNLDIDHLPVYDPEFEKYMLDTLRQDPNGIPQGQIRYSKVGEPLEVDPY